VGYAVDDLDSDTFVNPAKAVRIGKPLISGDFSHQGYSYNKAYEWSDVRWRESYLVSSMG